MYARLRSKITITSSNQTANSPNSNSLGTIAMSLYMKDMARVITGYITTTSDLNPNLWDIPNSEIVRTVAPGWNEYQSNYANTSTNIPIDTTGNTNIMYFRTTNAANTANGSPIYKYVGIGWNNNSSTLTSNYFFNFFNPWSVTDYVGNPTLTFRYNYNNTVAPTNLPLRLDVLYEFIIYASPRAIFISAQGIGYATASKVMMFAEYPSTPQSQIYNLPNQILYQVGSAGVANTAGTAFNTTAYNVSGGYNPGDGNDLTGYAVSSNLGIVYTYTPTLGTPGYQSLWSTATATGDLSTMKPGTYSSMANTTNASGATITIPVMPLLHYPAWDTVYDLSSLTGIYGTRSNLGASGDTLTINGQNYAYVNVTNMSYLVPRQ